MSSFITNPVLPVDQTDLQTNGTGQDASSPQYKGYHHMTWYVGNAKQAASYYVTRLGFRYMAFQGLETGHRCVSSLVITNGGVTFVICAPLRDRQNLEKDTSESEKRLLTEIHTHLAKHGDAVKDVAFEVNDACAVYHRAMKNGAVSVQEPATRRDECGEVTTAIIRTYGDTTHTLVEKNNYRGMFMPGYRTIDQADPIQKYLPQISLEAIDHCVGNQDWGQMQTICDYYESKLAFHRFWSPDDNLLSTSFSAMNSIVMASPPPSLIKMPINEPAIGLKKSQIEEFVDFHSGAGVQHIAFRCQDIVATVQALRERGVEFIDVPSTYYEALHKRLDAMEADQKSKKQWKLREDLKEVERLKILIDFDEGGYLLQIFSKPVLDRPTVFIEIIQRENFEGFGAGNFKGLFEAIQLEQERRGSDDFDQKGRSDTIDGEKRQPLENGVPIDMGSGDNPSNKNNPARGTDLPNGQNPLPDLLQTPSGLAILELQGTINIPSMSTDSTETPHASNPAAITVGRLVFPDHNPDDPTGSTSWMKRVHLYIGKHQRLTGEVKKLATPLGVMRRRPVGEDDMTGTAEELEIMEIVYYKVLFSSRPEPAFSIFIVWAILVSIRNAYFHPLSKFPGPKSAAATPIPFVKALTSGHMVDWVMGLHAKYGPVVRTGPDELSFIGPRAWQDIYITRPQLPKTKKGIIQSMNGAPVIVTQTITEEHSRQRRILSPAFSERAVREQEDILKHYTDLLITKLTEHVEQTEKKSSVTLDMNRWYNYTTFDIVGDLIFNDPFHSLENSADHPWVAAVFDGTKFGILLTAFDYFPPMPSVVKCVMPQSMRKAAAKHFQWSQEKITRRMQMQTKRPDLMTYILGNNQGEEKMSRDEIDSNGAFFILAGSETSALTCSSATFFFLKKPAVYEKLRKEIRDAFGSADDITSQAANKLPYLRAVIWEALRLHPPAAVSSPRLVDRPGVVVDGHDIPVGTRVGISGKTMTRSPLNFVEPNSFIPERWLPDADSKFDADRKDAQEPFMVGPRNCLGKPYENSLAWAEMNLILCKVLWHFDLKLAEGNKEDWSMEQRVFLLHERTPVFVKLTPRR
ncbi:MAG: hypothetical protein Q9215_005980 [Flavoplaca cf. flavocitrina]